MIQGRKFETLTEYFKQIPKSVLNQVKVIVIDMSPTYLKIARTYFRKAFIVIDKFHVVKHLVEALNDYRKRKQRLSGGYKQLYYQNRHNVCKRLNNLSSEQLEKTQILFELDSELKTFHELVQQFMNIYTKAYDKDKAEVKLTAWLKMAKRQDIPELNTFIKTFENHQEYILNYFDWKYTNGLIEGLNNKNKVIQRASYGFKKFNILRGKLMFEMSRRW